MHHVNEQVVPMQADKETRLTCILHSPGVLSSYALVGILKKVVRTVRITKFPVMITALDTTLDHDFSQRQLWRSAGAGLISFLFPPGSSFQHGSAGLAPPFSFPHIPAPYSSHNRQTGSPPPNPSHSSRT